MSFPERIRYGATELRRFYNQNLFMALGISVALHLGLIGLYLTGADDVAAHSDPVPTDTDGWTEILPDVEVPVENEIESSIPSDPANPNIGRPVTPMVPDNATPSLGESALGGDYQPVDDGLLAPDEGNVASGDDIATSTPNGKGNGGSPNGKENGLGGVPQQGGGGNGPAVTPPADDIPNEFPEPNVVMPDIDLAELSSRAEYPRLARENGIEGKVTVKVLIGEDGRALRTSIEGSSNEILDSAAIRAVRGTIFKPATLNGEPVRAWLFLPISFTLN